MVSSCVWKLHHASADQTVYAEACGKRIGKKTMHEIDPQKVQAAYRHLEIALQHGRQVEQLGHLLQEQDPTAQETGQHLEAWGQEIQ
jgi:hypothetical protein